MTTINETIEDRYRDTHRRSAELYRQACTVFPSGVTHDVRYLQPFPLTMASAQGARKLDVDGHEYVDYVMGHGALLLGHAHPAVVAAVRAQVARGTQLGGNTELELEWGRSVQRLMPSVERIRFVSSGTEATLMAMRLARAFTGRSAVLRFAGHFHGWQDYAVASPAAAASPDAAASPGVAASPDAAASPGAAASPDAATSPGAVGSPGAAASPEAVADTRTGRAPTTPGLSGPIPSAIGTTVHVIPPDDPGLLEATLAANRDIAALIVEPTGAHMGQIPLAPAFVHDLVEIARRHGVLVIFDEVVTGFRVAPGGAQQRLGIRPDLTTMAKILAGGLPGGAVGGRAEIVDQIAFPDPGAGAGAGAEALAKRERVEHPGTFNANPLSAAAGTTCLGLVATQPVTTQADRAAARLCTGLNQAFADTGTRGFAYHDSSLVHAAPNLEGDASPAWLAANRERLDAARAGELPRHLRLALLNEGVDTMRGINYIVSAAHTDADVDHTVAGFTRALAALRREGMLQSR